MVSVVRMVVFINESGAPSDTDRDLLQGFGGSVRKSVQFAIVFGVASAMSTLFFQSAACADDTSVDDKITDVRKRLREIETGQSKTSEVTPSQVEKPVEKHKKKSKTRHVDRQPDGQSDAQANRPKEPVAASEQPKVATPAPRDSSGDAPVVADAAKTESGQDGKAVEFHFVTKYQYLQVNPGEGPSKAFHLSNVDLKAEVNLQKAMGWEGWRFRTWILGNFGGAPSEVSGDAQGPSNIEAPGDFTKIYEANIEKSFADDAFVVLAGLRDLNADFYANDAAGLFLNSSFGVGAELAHTGENGPSIFPTTATAIVLKTQAGKNFYFNHGLFDAVAGDMDHPLKSHFHYDPADGYLAISEAGFARSESSGPGIALTKAGVGHWQYSRPVARIDDDASMDVNAGAYGIIEAAMPGSTRLFVRHGFANPKVNAIETNSAFGLVRNGMIKSGDSMGIGVTEVRFGHDAAALQPEDEPLVSGRKETALEWTWRIPVTSWISLQPDYQHILNPSARRSSGKATSVASMRIDFEM